MPASTCICIQAVFEASSRVLLPQTGYVRRIFEIRGLNGIGWGSKQQGLGNLGLNVNKYKQNKYKYQLLNGAESSACLGISVLR